jgi:hypothetical protein
MVMPTLCNYIIYESTQGGFLDNRDFWVCLTMWELLVLQLQVSYNISESSKDIYLEVINNLVSIGAEGIVLGCTEIPLLIQQKDCEARLFDTTTIHALAAVDLALK